mmetsp:Transcript_24734/g.78998  ORF Transcript_24734/g.78998 Transcript_24734/m.78998 type:complete len:204 (+) Transcript_24734:410-1021(+)
MSVLSSRTPATARESIASGSAREVSRRIASGMPRTSRCTTSRVASGVTSRGDRPVPPVESTRLHWSASCTSARLISSASSGTSARLTGAASLTDCTLSAKPTTQSSISGPDSSWYIPAAARSLTVRMPSVTSTGPVATCAAKDLARRSIRSREHESAASGSSQQTSEAIGRAAGATGGCAAADAGVPDSAGLVAAPRSSRSVG